MGRGRERGRSFRNWKLKFFRSGRRKTRQSSKNMHLFLLFVCLQTRVFKAELENETGWIIWCSLESGDGADKLMGLRDFGYKDGSVLSQKSESLHSLSYGRSSVTVTIQGTECQERTLVCSFPSTKSRTLFECNEQWTESGFCEALRLI